MTLGQRKLEAAQELARIYQYLSPDVRPNGWTDAEWYSRQEAAVIIGREFNTLTIYVTMYEMRRPWVSTYVVTRDREQGAWVPACNGTEVPFTARNGQRLLYCWQPLTGNHAYIDVNTDMVLTTEQALRAMGQF